VGLDFQTSNSPSYSLNCHKVNLVKCFNGDCTSGSLQAVLSTQNFQTGSLRLC
jgi:hypothetical protein